MKYITPRFRLNCVVELMEDIICEHLEEAFKINQNSFEEFTQRGSGWTLERILKLELNMAKYQPLSPSNYIPLPKTLVDKKKAILNIKNEDQKCFVWCLLAYKLKIDYENNANSVHHCIPHELEIKLDSFRFLPTSLQNLVHNLKESDFSILKQNVSKEKIHLLRKGIHPYEYVDNFQKFLEIALPPASAFYSTLSGEYVSAEDYEQEKNLWSTFKIKSLGEYHYLYVATDVLLLADVFENFRKICLKNYELNPAHYVTSSSLAWQACLKIS
ncbi:protein NYNRIN [Nephila pilipes]|uniref:Protein NYNRIN n=1 Tax=Nephila pilipes TaxID=299642 RepID=A0A8X6T7G0_NEPPI|nr:protein NYNRIN [Nephila pilipes]